MNARLKNQLTLAYLNTLFPVDFPGQRIVISPLSDNEELRAHCKAHRIRHWALITPMNPGSRTLPDEENSERLREFKKMLEGFRCHESVSVPADGTPELVGAPMPEIGFFIENLFPWEAVKLGFKWGQNAILVGTDEGPAELVWTEHESGTYFSRPK